MIPFIGRGLSMALAFRRYPASWDESEQNVQPIEQVYENANMLLTQMQQRKEHWEREIAYAQDQLRQVEAIISATYRMTGTLLIAEPSLGETERIEDSLQDYTSTAMESALSAIVEQKAP